MISPNGNATINGTKITGTLKPDSEEDYVNSFSPSKPASKYIPNILSSEYPDAVKGEYVIVNYNTCLYKMQNILSTLI